MVEIVADPAVDVTVGALAISLVTLLGYAVAFGLVSVVHAVLRAFFHFTESTVGKVVGWIPGAGKWVNGQIEAAEQKATGYLGAAAVSLEGHVGDAFHASADQALSVGHEIYGLALFSYQTVAWINYHLNPQAIGARFGMLERHAKHTQAAVAHTQSQSADLRKSLRDAHSGPAAAAAREAVKPIDARTTWIDTHELPGIRARQRAAEQTIPHDLAGLRSRVAEAERVTGRLWERVRHLDKVTTGALATALVATALGRLGIQWIRCSNWRKIGRAGCRIPAGLLEAILGDTIEAFIVADLCLFIDGLSRAMAEFEPVLLAFVDVEDVLIGCHGITKPPPLPIGPLDLPPAQAVLGLAL